MNEIKLYVFYFFHYVPESIWSSCFALLFESVNEMRRPSDFCPVAFKNIFHYALLISSVSQLHFAWWLNTNACLLKSWKLRGFVYSQCDSIKKTKEKKKQWKNSKKELYAHKLQRFLVAPNQKCFGSFLSVRTNFKLEDRKFLQILIKIPTMNLYTCLLWPFNLTVLFERLALAFN